MATKPSPSSAKQPACPAQQHTVSPPRSRSTTCSPGLRTASGQSAEPSPTSRGTPPPFALCSCTNHAQLGGVHRRVGAALQAQRRYPNLHRGRKARERPHLHSSRRLAALAHCGFCRSSIRRPLSYRRLPFPTEDLKRFAKPASPNRSRNVKLVSRAYPRPSLTRTDQSSLYFPFQGLPSASFPPRSKSGAPNSTRLLNSSPTRCGSLQSLAPLSTCNEARTLRLHRSHAEIHPGGHSAAGQERW